MERVLSLIIIMIFIISSCAPSMDQERQKLLAPAYKMQADSDAKLKEDIQNFKKQDEAFHAQVDKLKQRQSTFIASLSDKELLAFSACNKAQKDKDNALIAFNFRKLVNLLKKSGNIGVYLSLCQENDELLAKAKALDKKQDELKKRIAQSEHFWATKKRLDREWEDWKQHHELVDAIRSINKPRQGFGTIMTPSGGIYFYNYTQY
jgi:hypothetical protein